MNKQLPLFGALVLASSSVLAHQQWQGYYLGASAGFGFNPGDNGELEFQPEFVFDTQQQQVNRFFAGTRFLFGVLALTLEADIADNAQTYSGRVGFDF